MGAKRWRLSLLHEPPDRECLIPMVSLKYIHKLTTLSGLSRIYFMYITILEEEEAVKLNGRDYEKTWRGQKV